MKLRVPFLLSGAALCVMPQFAQSQTSTMEFQAGTSIEVTSGADICADNVTINGTYSGSGTQCGSVLPIELVAVSAQTAKTSVVLHWTTATERENFGFSIERRTMGGAEWANVGFVHGSGSSTTTRTYSFTDENVQPGSYAYRIRQIDQTGSFSFSAALEVEVGLAPKVFTLNQNYPNPFNPTTTIEFTLPKDGHVRLRIYDIAGREVRSLVDEERRAGIYHQVLFDASHLGSGTYIAALEFGGKQLIRKMTVVK